MERNFAALKLPRGINFEDNQSQINNNNNSTNSGRPSLRAHRIIVQKCYFHEPIFEAENFLKISHFISSSSQQIGGVFEVILPISRTLKSITWSNRSVAMEDSKFLNRSQEPMEIEEISYAEPTCGVEPIIKEEKTVEDSETLVRDVLRPKVILRESKLTNIWEVPSSIKNMERVSGVDKLEGRDKEEKELAKSSDSYDKIKSKIRPLVKKPEKEKTDTLKSKFSYFWQMLFFILFPIAVIVTRVTISRDEFHSNDCSHRFDPSEAIKNLEQRVFGQTQAIDELNYHLTLNSSEFKIVAIIGGIGTGKSYTAHLIGENFNPKKNIFQYVLPLKQWQRYAPRMLSFCGCNLIVLENLSNKDIIEAAEFVEALKNDSKNYCVLVIEVINVQETDDNLKHEIDLTKSKMEIDNLYRNKKLDIKIVTFEPLDDHIVKKCIIEAAKERNLILSNSEIDQVWLSVKNADSGCKGVHAKVQLLDNKLGI